MTSAWKNLVRLERKNTASMAQKKIKKDDGQRVFENTNEIGNKMVVMSIVTAMARP